MGVACPPSILTSGAQRTSCIGRRRVGSLQVPSRAPFGEPRPPSPTRRPASLGEAAETDRRRSTVPIGNPIRAKWRLTTGCGGRRIAGNPLESAGSGLVSMRSQPSDALGRSVGWVQAVRRCPCGVAIPEEESGTADLRPPVVGNDGAVRRPAEPPRLAPSPAAALVAVPANPSPGRDAFLTRDSSPSTS